MTAAAPTMHVPRHRYCRSAAFFIISPDDQPRSRLRYLLPATHLERDVLFQNAQQLKRHRRSNNSIASAKNSTTDAIEVCTDVCQQCALMPVSG